MKQIDRPTALQPPNPPYSPWAEDDSNEPQLTSREQQIRLKALLLTSALMTLILTSLPQIGSWFKAMPPQSQHQQVQGSTVLSTVLPVAASDESSEMESSEMMVIQVSQPEDTSRVTLQLTPTQPALIKARVNQSLESREAAQSTTIVLHPEGGQSLKVVIRTQAK